MNKKTHNSVHPLQKKVNLQLRVLFSAIYKTDKIKTTSFIQTI